MRWGLGIEPIRRQRRAKGSARVEGWGGAPPALGGTRREYHEAFLQPYAGPDDLCAFANCDTFHPLEAMADLALGHTLACLGQSKGCAEREGEVIAAWAKQVTSITKRVRESGGFGGRIVLRTSLINFGFDQRGAENRVKLHMNAFLRKMAASSTPSSPGDTGPGPSRTGIYVLDVEALTMQRPETVSIMHVGSVRNTKKLIYATNVGNVG